MHANRTLTRELEEAETLTKEWKNKYEELKTNNTVREQEKMIGKKEKDYRQQVAEK